MSIRKPSVTQELLLEAALVKGSAAVGAWREWRTRVGTDDLDAFSERLLPLLWANVGSAGVDPDHPRMQQARKTHRLTWGRNRMLFCELTRLLKAMADAGVPVLLLKGAALAARYYRDYGLRPMADMDLLVPTVRTEEAVRLLRSRRLASCPVSA